MNVEQPKPYDSHMTQLAIQSILIETVGEDELRAVLKKLLDKAMAGDVEAADLLLRWLTPPR